jgi:hypothetical protein
VVALGTFTKNFFYHANINPLDSEDLTQQQWTYAVELLEQNLGLERNARFIVEHRKKGRTHRHVIWSRIDVVRMRAVPMTHDYAKHQATARQLESEFGLQPVESVLGPDRVKGQRPTRRPKTWESFRGKKSGVDPHAMKQHITALYRSSRDGRQFVQALKEHGYQLIRGDSRNFCVVDAAGQVHSLARRLDSVDAAALAAHLRDIDPRTLMLASQVKNPIVVG